MSRPLPDLGLFELATWMAEQDLDRALRDRDRRRAARLTLAEREWFRGPARESAP